jgi:hypothetical protein
VVQSVLTEVDDPDLSVHVVWVPILLSDRANTVGAATRLVPDPRAAHYWDPDLDLANALRAPLGIEQGVAWDVYLLYGRASRWPAANPPVPTHVQHQLFGMPEELLLDGPRLEESLRQLLAQGRPRG